MIGQLASSALVDLDRLREATVQMSAMVDSAVWCRTPEIRHWSSIGWQFGHIATFEQAFVLERLKGDRPLSEPLKEKFMPATALPPERIAVPPRDDLLAYVRAIRSAVREYVGNAPASADLDFTLAMLVEHESMHLEHLLHMAMWIEPEHLERTRGPMALGPSPALAASPCDAPQTLRVEAGLAPIGNPVQGALWDNERPAHERQLEAFEIDRLAVTNGQFLEFVEAGGYNDRRWWSDAGWGAIELTGALNPFYWRQQGDDWRLRRLFGEVALPLDQPVMGVSWFEAEAFARWRGRRLPTEFEWERAAQLTSATSRANCGFEHDGPVPGDPDGADFLGNVWEWTASWFEAYDGFAPGPYDRYSEPQFGKIYRVLKGGCWATLPEICRPTFRNWYNPYLRPVFAGLRLAGPPVES